jgi:putative pyruvate formate lyase activating enzyme
MNGPASGPPGESGFAACRLCPRDCGVDRRIRPGLCGESDVCRLAAAVAHFGEEPPISGSKGSGTLFFSGCSCHCFFCQNEQISTSREGRAVSADELGQAAARLIAAGVHNLNFVTPDHVWPHIEALCARLRAGGATLPFVFNGSGYHRADRIETYAARMEIFLPDFKFADPLLADECMADRRYPDLAIEAIRRMVEARGFLEPFDPEGKHPAREGVLVRHLVLPDEEANSLAALRRLREEFGRWLPLSVMSQFRPMPACHARGRMTRTVSPESYARVCDEVAALGFEQVFIQPQAADDAFLPDFRREEPFEGNGRTP